MGGNALNGKRFTKKELVQYRRELRPLLEDYFGNIFFTNALGEKEDFGDLDIVVTNPIRSTWKEELWSRVPGEKHSNSNCHSFLYDGIQVDLILVPNKEFYWAQYYYSNNDLGNLIGRIARNLGFTFGNDGFHYTYSIMDGNFTKRITITHDVWKALDFMGYRNMYPLYDTWKDMFEWVASSPLFHPGYYHFCNRNHEGRHRDKKRPNYLRFLEWLDATYPLDVLADEDFYQCKKLHLIRAFTFFPGFKSEYDSVVAEGERFKAIKEAFNGSLVSRLLDIFDKDLGSFMAYFRKREDFEELCLGDKFQLVEEIHNSYILWKHIQDIILP